MTNSHQSLARRVGVSLVAALSITTCKKSDIEAANGDDPIRALDARAPTARYVHEFWLDQAKRKTAVWDSAYAICSSYWPHQDGSKPNCGHVYTANFYNAGATTPVRSTNMIPDSQRARP
jgi:hypothetical protein